MVLAWYILVYTVHDQHVSITTRKILYHPSWGEPERLANFMHIAKRPTHMLVTTQCHASRWSMQLLWLHTLTLLSHSNHELAGESLLCMSGLACCCAWHLPEVNIGIVHCAVCNSLPALSRGCQTIYHCMLQTHST